jgi:hypothetical protein
LDKERYVFAVAVGGKPAGSFSCGRVEPEEARSRGLFVYSFSTAEMSKFRKNLVGETAGIVSAADVPIIFSIAMKTMSQIAVIDRQHRAFAGYDPFVIYFITSIMWIPEL